MNYVSLISLLGENQFGIESSSNFDFFVSFLHVLDKTRTKHLGQATFSLGLDFNSSLAGRSRSRIRHLKPVLKSLKSWKLYLQYILHSNERRRQQYLKFALLYPKIAKLHICTYHRKHSTKRTHCVTYDIDQSDHEHRMGFT